MITARKQHVSVSSQATIIYYNNNNNNNLLHKKIIKKRKAEDGIKDEVPCSGLEQDGRAARVAGNRLS